MIDTAKTSITDSTNAVLFIIEQMDGNVAYKQVYQGNSRINLFIVFLFKEI